MKKRRWLYVARLAEAIRPGQTKSSLSTKQLESKLHVLFKRERIA